MEAAFVVRELWSSTRGHCCEGRLIWTNTLLRRSMSPSLCGKKKKKKNSPPPFCASSVSHCVCVCVCVCVLYTFMHMYVCRKRTGGRKKKEKTECVHSRACCHSTALSLLSVCWEYVVLSSHRRSKLLNVKVVLVPVPGRTGLRVWNVKWCLHNLHVVPWQQGESVALDKSESVSHATAHLWAPLGLLLYIYCYICVCLSYRPSVRMPYHIAPCFRNTVYTRQDKEGKISISIYWCMIIRLYQHQDQFKIVLVVHWLVTGRIVPLLFPPCVQNVCSCTF